MQPVSPSIKAILYDLDGTLIDHFRAIHRAIVFAQEQLGLPPSSYDKVRATVGGSIEVTMARLIGPELTPRGVTLFQEHLRAIMLEDLLPLAGAAWLLEQLHARGLRQAIVTNKGGDVARAISRHLGWDPWLELVLGTHDIPWRKPMPEFPRYALDKLGVTAEVALLVGDSTFDIETAAAAGLRCQLVTTGSHTRAQLLAHQPPPEAVFDDLFQLGEKTFGLAPPVVAKS
jgi:phosphoglycolate phosphatase